MNDVSPSVKSRQSVKSHLKSPISKKDQKLKGRRTGRYRIPKGNQSTNVSRRNAAAISFITPYWEVGRQKGYCMTSGRYQWWKCDTTRISTYLLPYDLQPTKKANGNQTHHSSPTLSSELTLNAIKLWQKSDHITFLSSQFKVHGGGVFLAHWELMYPVSLSYAAVWGNWYSKAMIYLCEIAPTWYWVEKTYISNPVIIISR